MNHVEHAVKIFEDFNCSQAVCAAFAEKFTERQGSLLCRHLLECDISTTEGLAYAREHNLFTEQCPVFIRVAAEILEDMLHEEG
jgi:hypothetical protein